jgi:RNA polymerase sigma-70 factor, ECF subfamily
MQSDDTSNQPSTPESQSHSKWATRSSMLIDLKGISQERWTDFLFLYEPLLLYWMRKKGVPDSDVDDVLSESWSSIYKGIGNFDRGSGKGTFRGWLRTIVERRAIDHFRKQKREIIEVSGGAEEIINQAIAPEQKSADAIEDEEAALNEVRARAMELVKSSTQQQTWDMFWMSAVDNVPTADIAAEFGVSSAAVRVAKQRVTKRLKEALRDDWA